MSDLKHTGRRKQKLIDKIKSKKRRKAKRKVTISAVIRRIDESIDVFDYDKAVKWARKGLEISPDNMVLLEKVGPILLEAGLVDEAHSCFSRAVEVSPETGAAKYLYLGQLSNGKEAVSYLLKGIELLNREGESLDKSKDMSTAYCSLAEIYLTDECFSDNADVECHKYCEKAIASCPGNPEAYQLLASYLLSRDKTEEACSTLLKGINLWLPLLSDDEKEEEGDQVNSHTHSAGDQAQQVPSVDPPSYESRINCAKLLIEVGQRDKANRVLGGLIREDDEVLGVWYLLGWCYFQTEQNSLSRSCLSKVIELSKKFDCDEEEIIEHSRQLLQEIGLKSPEDTEQS